MAYTLRQALVDACIAAVLVGLILLVKFHSKTIFGVESPIVVVDGRSMLPLFSTGDIVFITRAEPDQIKVGDIIVYRSLLGGYIVHRVVKVVVKDGKYYYVTKGDNNLLPDYFEFEGKPGVPYERVVGVVVKVNNIPIKVPLLGLIILALRLG